MSTAPAHRALVASLAACAVFVSAAPAGAIVGGSTATDSGSTVFLLGEKDATKTEPASTKTCTGTLVARSVVLTAAHCVENDPDRVRVFAGLLDLATAPSASNDFLVTRIQESRDFEKGATKATKPSDIAYLELGRNATQTPSSMSYDRPKAGADGRSRGYGAIAENVVDGKGVVPPEGANTLLREGLVRIVNCPKGAYKDVFCSNYTKSTPGIGPCRGDSGGPLLSPISKKLVGVYSGSAAGCKTNASYANLSDHKEFITETIKPRVTGRVFNQVAVTAAEAMGTRPDDARVANKVPKAVVKARDQDGKLQSSTPIVAGRFTLPVKKGTYDLEVIAKGFKTLIVKKVAVKFPRALDAGLVPGASTPTTQPGKVSCPGGVNPDGTDGDFYSKIVAEKVTCAEALTQTRAYVVASDSGYQKSRSVRGYTCIATPVNGTLSVRCAKSGGEVVSFVGQS